jgi:hypothetical protein
MRYPDDIEVPRFPLRMKCAAAGVLTRGRIERGAGDAGGLDRATGWEK